MIVQRLVKKRNSVEIPLKAADIAAKFRSSMLRHAGELQVSNRNNNARAKAHSLKSN